MKKRLLLFVAMFIVAVQLMAQVGINADNSAPDGSAMLDVKSVNRGFLPPRMTTEQMNSIVTPLEGLLVYNTSVNSLYWFNGTTWKRFNEFSYTETDPIFGVHPASGITSGNIANWNTAYANRLISSTGTAPLTLTLSNNQLSGSISAANSTTNGYLKSTDWNTFNNKQNSLTFGSVTSGDMSTTGNGMVVGGGLNLTITKGNLAETASSVLTIAGGTNAVLGTGTTISVKQAAASQSGYLSAADWNNFNNKISSQWTANGTKLHYNSGNVGIGTSNPQSKVDIAGNAVIGSVYSGINAAPVNGLLVEGQVGVGTSSPSASAALDISSTNSGILIPRMTNAQRNAISSPAEGLMVMCTNCGFGGGAELTFYSSGSWYTIPKQPQWTCGMPITKNHTAGDVSPVTKTTTYGTVTGIPGEAAKCWITSNLGSDHQATAVNDATEPSAGWYWQFNRKQGYKHTGSALTPAWTITSISESSDWLTANDPCNLELGTAWRIPTYTEWYNVDNTGGWTNWNGPWGSGLKLHAAGVLNDSGGSLNYRGSGGNYWSSTQNSSTHGWNLGFNSGASITSYNVKASGFSLRCLRD
ncbi:MAG: hypothetical protein NT004_00185 [Bacteroidetes bacterium]|nr:hypothetical protein [Bacteroidota bacterium]